jgi:hypothetical protein
MSGMGKNVPGCMAEIVIMNPDTGTAKIAIMNLATGKIGFTCVVHHGVCTGLIL